MSQSSTIINSETSSLNQEDFDTKLWFVFTIASLSKRLGALSERFLFNPIKLNAVKQIEAKMEALIFNCGAENDNYSLLVLTQELDRLK